MGGVDMVGSIERDVVVAEPSAGAHARRIEELGRIIMAYSEVTDKLQASHEQLQQTVTALREELGEKNRLLERRNRLAALGEMAAGMAHEIRNPLGGIALYASMLARDVEHKPESLGLVHKISGGVKRLEALVSQVLQFTREIRPARAECDLVSVIRDALDLSAGRLDACGASLHTSGPAALRVVVDPLLMGQCVMNLVINAAEAAGQGGAVDVAWSKDQRGVCMSVSDNGPGIAPEVMDRIFNPFFTTKDHGTGLGLAIVHRIVEAHDGTIVARNIEPRGARFEIRLG